MKTYKQLICAVLVFNCVIYQKIQEAAGALATLRQKEQAAGQQYKALIQKSIGALSKKEHQALYALPLETLQAYHKIVQNLETKTLDVALDNEENKLEALDKLEEKTLDKLAEYLEDTKINGLTDGQALEMLQEYLEPLVDHDVNTDKTIDDKTIETIDDKTIETIDDKTIETIDDKTIDDKTIDDKTIDDTITKGIHEEYLKLQTLYNADIQDVETIAKEIQEIKIKLKALFDTDVNKINTEAIEILQLLERLQRLLEAAAAETTETTETTAAAAAAVLNNLKFVADAAAAEATRLNLKATENKLLEKSKLSEKDFTGPSQIEAAAAEATRLNLKATENKLLKKTKINKKDFTGPSQTATRAQRVHTAFQSLQPLQALQALHKHIEKIFTKETEILNEHPEDDDDENTKALYALTRERFQLLQSHLEKIFTKETKILKALSEDDARERLQLLHEHLEKIFTKERAAMKAFGIYLKRRRQ